MTLSHRPVTIILYSFLVIGCFDGSPDSSSDRSPIGKADLVGLCAGGPNGNFCGGMSDGNCWCDSSCEDFGDCCGDSVSVCEDRSQLGEECGDDVAVLKQCAPGLVCVFPTTTPISEHTPGTCQVPDSNQCEQSGGTCFGGTVNCDAALPGTEDQNLDCGASGPNSPQLTCCVPTASECEQSGGTCFGGTLNCPVSVPGTNISDLDCAGDSPNPPQLTCCMPD